MYGEKGTIAGDFEKFLNEYEKAGVILPIPGGTRVARMNRVKKMLEERRIKRWKISTKLLLLILVMGAVSLGLFWFLWVHQADAATFLESSGLVKWFDSEEFEENLQREAKNYSVPAAEDDTEGQKEIQPFLDSVTDEYTGVYVYGQDDGLYRCGQITDIMRVYPFGSLLSMSQEILGSQYGDIPVEFQNGTFDVIYYSYHRSQFIYPYMIFSILLCVFVFLAGILVFMGRVMKRIFKVKDKISNMAQGDLAHPVPYCGEDEVGMLAKELDSLRETLDMNIKKEESVHRANRDLITAISHDLRTPLTVLRGYLDILRLKRCPEASRDVYVEKCIRKAEDIRVLTDRMFEYALVYEVDETAELKQMPVSVLNDILEDNCEFIRLAGFSVEQTLVLPEGCMSGDEIMLKRIFSNLFSNILKYGDKKHKVTVEAEREHGKTKIVLANGIKSSGDEVESSRIGLKSTEKMVRMHKGSMHIERENNTYIVNISI